MQITYDDEDNEFLFSYEDPLDDDHDIEVRVALDRPFANFHKAYLISKQFTEVGAELISSIYMCTDGLDEAQVRTTMAKVKHDTKDFLNITRTENASGAMPPELFEVLELSLGEAISALDELEVLGFEDLIDSFEVFRIDLTELGGIAHLSFPGVAETISTIEFSLRNKIPGFDENWIVQDNDDETIH